MPSQANTFGPSGGEFICDTTQQSVTLTIPGGTVTNTGGSTAWINVDNNTVATADGNNSSNFPLPPNSTKRLPATCGAFTHKAAAGSANLIYEGRI